MNNIKKFDIVVMNPPYSTPRNKNNNQSTDLYQDFIDVAYKLSKKYVVAITPSRWWKKEGKKMEELRKKMINKYGLKLMTSVDPNAAFNLDIKGGVSYFLLETGYSGEVKVNGVNRDCKKILSDYGILLFLTKIEEEILNKTYSKKTMDNIFKSQSTFGVKTNDYRLSDDQFPQSIKCKVSKQKGNWKYFPFKEVKNIDIAKKYKLVFPAAYGKGNDFYRENDIFIVNPNEIVSESYIFFEGNKEYIENLYSYMDTRLIRFLFYLKKTKQHVTSTVFGYIPQMPENKKWNDKSVEEFYNLTKEQIKFLENFA
jgi:hypothetical protein